MVTLFLEPSPAGGRGEGGKGGSTSPNFPTLPPTLSRQREREQKGVRA